MLKTKRKKFLRYLIYTVLFLGAYGLCISIYLIRDGLKHPKETTELLVVMGNTVHKDGRLSKRLIKRLDCAIEAFHASSAKYVLVSGGLGKEGHWEAEKMKTYLVSKQIPPQCILVDNYGNTTKATVINTLKVKDSLGINNIRVCTQYFHVTRSKYWFKQFGCTAVSGVSPRYVEIRDFYAISREVVALTLAWTGFSR